MYAIMMIRGDTQTVGLLSTLQSVTWSVTRHFLSVIITIVMGDVRCVRVVLTNKMSMRPSKRSTKQTDSQQVGPNNVVIIIGRKCHDEVSDQE